MRHYIVRITLLFLVAMVVAQSSDVFAGGTGVCTWTPPTKNTDDSKLTDLAGYRLYWGLASRNYPQVMNVAACDGCPEPLGTEVEIGCIGGLTPGTTYYVAVTAYDTSGNESAYSNEVVDVISPPASPLGNIYIGGASIARVDGYDLNLISHCYGVAILGSSCTLANLTKWSSCEPADTNGDGKVDGADLAEVAGNFGRQY